MTDTNKQTNDLDGSDAPTCSAVWYAIADWGDYDIFNGRRDNITHDKHHSQEAAEEACRLLRQNGFGGNRQIFPVRTWAIKHCQNRPRLILRNSVRANAIGEARAESASSPQNQTP